MSTQPQPVYDLADVETAFALIERFGPRPCQKVRRPRTARLTATFGEINAALDLMARCRRNRLRVPSVKELLSRKPVAPLGAGGAGR